MKKLVILGLDGTIADTSPGMLYCFNTTAIAMGYPPVDLDSLVGVINGHLKVAFQKIYNMSEDEIEYAVKNYSKLYSQKGTEMFTLYKGIEENLRMLRDNGCKLAIATQKHSMYTRDILEVHGLTELFDAVCATDVDKELEKSDLIIQACDMLGVSVEESIFIGDSEVDALGAQQAGMDFAAVLYGLGFRSEEEAEKYNCKTYIASASELYKKISLV